MEWFNSLTHALRTAVLRGEAATLLTAFTQRSQRGRRAKVLTCFSGLANTIIFPALGVLAFVVLWTIAAHTVQTSSGLSSSPSAVLEQLGKLYQEHSHTAPSKITFVDQIGTSLVTVLTGFVGAVLIAVPLGIVLGLSKPLNAAINPLIQLFKPISPLAWLPLVTLVVSAVSVSPDPLLAKPFLTSAITVALCCLWPMLINTSIGVASLDSDLRNVSKVLNLSALTHLRKIVLPASMPMIFTGMRLSLSVAWMVLIAAEMLAQSPGLGKFIWDEFQHSNADAMSRILAAVLVIGVIGLLLDLSVLQCQRYLAWDKASAER